MVERVSGLTSSEHFGRSEMSAAEAEVGRRVAPFDTIFDGDCIEGADLLVSSRVLFEGALDETGSSGRTGARCNTGVVGATVVSGPWRRTCKSVVASIEP